MIPLERYLQRATRGLRGARRRDVQLELRGAVEDKIWRYSLAGHDTDCAEQLALRDLGDPARLAREFDAVYLAPRRLQVGLALSVAALLSVTGVRVAAQVAGAPYVQAQVLCDYSPAGLTRLEHDFGPQTTLRDRLKTEVSAHLEQQCTQVYRSRSDALDYPGLLQVLRERGVTFRTTPPEQTDVIRVYGGRAAPGTLWLRFPGTAYDVQLDPPIQTPDGRQVFYQQTLMENLLVSGLSVSLAGDVNPRVTVGTTAFTVGTPSAPVLATDLYTGAIRLQLTGLVLSQGLTSVYDYPDPAVIPTLPLNSPPAVIPSRLAPGTLVSGLMRVRASPEVVNTGLFTTRVKPEGVSIPYGRTAAQVEVVNEPEALSGAFPPGVQVKVLLVRLQHTDNLHNLSYALLRADQVRR